MSARRKSLLTLIAIPVAILMSLLAISVANAARSSSPSAELTAKPTIKISMFAYTTPASVKPGAKIKVVNKDSAAHTVTSDTAGVFDVNVPAKSTVFFKAPATKGTYKFHCTFHSTMHGALKVK